MNSDSLEFTLLYYYLMQIKFNLVDLYKIFVKMYERCQKKSK